MKYRDFMEAGLKTIRFEIGGFSIDDAARACHTSIRTYKKWESTRKYPPWVKSVLLAKAGIIQDTGFEGWQFVKGKLCSPEGYEFSAGEIRAMIYRYALIAELKYQLRLKDGSARDGNYSNVVIFPGNERKDSF